MICLEKENDYSPQNVITENSSCRHFWLSKRQTGRVLAKSVEIGQHNPTPSTCQDLRATANHPQEIQYGGFSRCSCYQHQPLTKWRLSANQFGAQEISDAWIIAALDNTGTSGARLWLAPGVDLEAQACASHLQEFTLEYLIPSLS